MVFQNKFNEDLSIISKTLPKTTDRNLGIMGCPCLTLNCMGCSGGVLKLALFFPFNNYLLTEGSLSDWVFINWSQS